MVPFKFETSSVAADVRMVDEWHHLPMDRLDLNLHDVVECPNVHAPVGTLQPDLRTGETAMMGAILCNNRMVFVVNFSFIS